MSWPILLSLPHSGLRIPPEVEDSCLLTPADILADGDEGGAEVYDFAADCAAFLRADIARAAVDLNRPADDFSLDGVIKTHTCYEIEVYSKPPDKRTISRLLERYYYPYHAELARLARQDGVKIGIDCHTMAATAPPIAAEPGRRRPLFCLSNAHTSCPDQWLQALASHLGDIFQQEVGINEPFLGGFITRSQPGGIPWLQLETSRTTSLSWQDKQQGVREALNRWLQEIGGVL